MDNQATELTAKLLVLGDRNVGKSATIVRYTTGRFIQDYGPTSHQWLYRHKLEPDTGQDASVLEFIEQRDTEMLNGHDDKHSVDQNSDLDEEMGERRQAIDNLIWASAYVILYAINDINSYTKAIRYLKFIENHINHKQPFLPRLSSTRYSRKERQSSGQSNAGKKSNRSQANQPHDQVSLKHTPIRKPILLLGNKKDLELVNRKVSTSEAKALAARHKATFAEVSVAKSNAHLTETMSTFIKTLDPIYLESRPYNLSESNLLPVSLARVQDYRSPPKAVVGNLDGPIKAQLINCQSVVSCLASSSDVARAEVISVKPRMTSSCKTIRPNRSCPEKLQAQTYYDRYENLKSSFVKVSIAIVGHASGKKASKCFKAASAPQPPDEEPRLRSASPARTSIDQGVLAHELNLAQEGNKSVFVTSSNWIKNHIKSNRAHNSISDPKLNHFPPLPDNKTIATSVGERFKKPLLKYSNRRKTVAFEPIQDCQVSDEPDQAINKTNSVPRSLAAAAGTDTSRARESGSSSYDSNRYSSSRSSSSLSTSEAFYQGNLNDWNDSEPMQSATPSLSNETGPTNSSRCESSRASISATDSYDNSQDEDEDTPPTLVANHTTSVLPSPANVNNNSEKRRRYQLVRSVQTTLSSLSKTSNMTPKKSFCSSLFRDGNLNSIAGLTGQIK